MSDLARSVARGYGRDRATADRTLRRLTDRLRQVPAAWAESGDTVYLVVPGSGNLIRTVNSVNFFGLKYPTADVTSVPTLNPPSGDGACPDGLTIASLVDNDNTAVTVWLGTRLKPAPASPMIQQMLGSFFKGSIVLCRLIVHMPIGAGPDTAPVYLPWRM